MRISDWSSDVCSSDLGQSISVAARRNRVMVHSPKTHYKRAEMAHAAVSKGFIMGFRLLLLPLACLALSGCVSAVKTVVTAPVTAVGQEIGRASCREGVCQYV